MNWEAIGAIGETVSAVAVIATLLFLAVQIRHSNRVGKEGTRIAIAEMKHRSNDSISRWSELLLVDLELEALWQKGRSGETLSKEEEVRFFRIARNFFGIHATSYYDYDAIGDEVSKNRMVEFTIETILENEGLEKVWKALHRTPFTNYLEFWDAVNNGISTPGA